jgi:hypothetical protein
LWVPIGCKQVRGVVVAQHNLEEIQILENQDFRKALANLGFAEIWVSPGFDHLFRFNEGAGESFNTMMTDFATASGYSELRYAPIAPMGHSAAASWPYYFAAWNPERTLAALSISGQWPYFRHPAFAPDIWGDRTIDFVPCLETMGEYESADSWANEGLYERKLHPLMPLSMFAGPAQSHFAASTAKIPMLALYLQKAAHYRLPAASPVDGPVKLNPIDPTKSGWLVERWHKDKPPVNAAAPVGLYKGDPSQAFWFFDEEMAKATEAYQAQYQGKKVQLLGYVQGDKVAPQSNTHQQVNLRLQPEADGLTFKLTGTFLDTIPAESPRPASWTGLAAGSPVGHAAGGPVAVDIICGPAVKVSPDTFRVQIMRGLGDKLNRYDIWFTATQPGDDVYKPAVQQGLMQIPARNNKGAEQHITFPEIADMKPSAKPVTLRATSDSGLPVSYYVLAGPAEIDGDKLTLTPVPPRAKYPVTVTVVAWQYGRAVEPTIKTADPMTRTFSVTK